jgi:hypothetical protein
MVQSIWGSENAAIPSRMPAETLHFYRTLVAQAQTAKMIPTGTEQLFLLLCQQEAQNSVPVPAPGDHQASSGCPARRSGIRLGSEQQIQQRDHMLGCYPFRVGSGKQWAWVERAMSIDAKM